MPRGKPLPKTVPMPQDWRDKFKSSAIRVGFQVSLTRPMLEFLCAISDEVHWDRTHGSSSVAVPDNWIATGTSLEKRGLIVRKTQAEIDANEIGDHAKWTENSHWKLTDAGRLVVQLVQMAGVFVESDAAITKKSRRA